MYETGDDFFPDTGLAQNENRNICGGDMPGDIDDPQHLRIRRENVSLFYVSQLLLQGLDFFLQAVFLNGVLDCQLESFFFKRFRQVIRGAQIHGFDNGLDLANSRENDDRNRRVNGFEV